MENPRKYAEDLLDLVDGGVLDAREVLANVLMNYMSADDANDFALSEYLEA